MTMASPPKRLQLDAATKQDQCSRSHGQRRHQTSADFWLQFIHKCYPNLHKQSYFCPPLPHFNRVHYTSQTVANLTVLVPEKPSGSAGESRQNAQVSSSAQMISAQMSSLPQTSLCQPSCKLSSTLVTSQSMHSEPLNVRASEIVESQPGLSLSMSVPAHSSHDHQSINSQHIYKPAHDKKITRDQPDQPCFSQKSTWQDQRYQSQQNKPCSDQLAHNSTYPHHEERGRSQENYHVIKAQKTHKSEYLQQPYQFMQTAQQTTQSQQTQKSALSVQKQHSVQTHRSNLLPNVLHDQQVQSEQLRLSDQSNHLKRDAQVQRSTTHFNQSHTLPSRQMNKSMQSHQSRQSKHGLFLSEMKQPSQSLQSRNLGHLQESPKTQQTSQLRRPNISPIDSSMLSRQSYQTNILQPHQVQKRTHSFQSQQMHQSSQSRASFIKSYIIKSQESLLSGQFREVVQPLQSGSLSQSQHYLNSQQTQESTESRQAQLWHHPVQLRHPNHSQNLHQVEESACSNQSQQIQQAVQSTQTAQDAHREQSQQVQNTYIYKMWKSHVVRKLPIVIDSHVRDDNALHRVLACLDEMSKDGKEVMMVISQLEFGHYLNKPSYAAAASILPRPINLGEEYQRGDFDLLIIHSKYGIVTGEIKSIGDNFNQLCLTDSEQDANLIKVVNKALKQLSKSYKVLSHLVSDMQGVNIFKTLILPNVKEGQLRRALKSDPKTEESLCVCLGVKTLDDAIKLCLLSEDLSEKDTPWDVAPSKERFQKWWQRRVIDNEPQPSVTRTMYEQLVARFCGPATTIHIHCISVPRIELRTEWESVSETGERMAGLVLFPDQVELLNSYRPLVFLSGPPGTGKTVILTIKGLAWLQKGFDVHVISIHPGGRAVSMVIEHQLRQSWSENTPNIFRLEYKFINSSEITAAAKSLTNLTDENGTLCAIVDEASRFDTRYWHRFEDFKEFCSKLQSEVPNLFLWAAAVEILGKPYGFEEFIFRTPLRSPPAVIREVVTTGEMKPWKSVLKYASCKTPIPTHGPPAKRIRHYTKNYLGHTGKKSFECHECGHQAAQILTELKVGHTCENELLYRDNNDCNGPPPLQYRDVLVVWDVRRKSKIEWNKKMLTDLGFIQGLRDNHIPVGVVLENDEAAVRDMALALTDQVTVVERTTVRGLERKVVFVAGDYRKKIRSCDRLHSASRCTSQLVFID